MDTRNRLIERLRAAAAARPAAPGLVLVAALLAAALGGWTVTSVTWFWPAWAALLVLAIGMNTVRQDVRRRALNREHQQRMDTANALLNEQPPVHPQPELTGSIRELGGLVERFGHKLDDLLAEVHTEKSAAEPRSHRS
jgi:hypothetical protein